MIITLAGNNHFLLSHRLNELTDNFIKKHDELAVERIDAEETELPAIFDALQSSSFLSNEKLVVLKNISSNKAAAEAIEQIISSVSAPTDLIIYETSPDKRTAYFKVLKSKTELEELNGLDPLALAKWLVVETKKQGGKLALADANYMIDRIGIDQEQLFNELSKLLTYDPDISRQNIDLLTVETPQSKVFDLLDASFSGNRKLALDLYGEQRAQKVEPQAIMAMITWQLRLLALAKLASKNTSAQIAKDAGVSPYPIMKAQKLASKIEERHLEKMVGEALRIDELGKTRSINLDEALRSYIATL